MLLRFIYEFPNLIPKSPSVAKPDRRNGSTTLWSQSPPLVAAVAQPGFVKPLESPPRVSRPIPVMHLKTKTGIFLIWLTMAAIFLQDPPRIEAQARYSDTKGNDSTADTKSAQKNEKEMAGKGRSGVIRDRVNGLDRITGKVKVLNAHTLVFDDGTEVELNGGMDAPELDQKGLVGGAFYPCGKEAAEFLRKMINDQRVTCFIFGKKGNKVRGDCFVQETHLEIEMVRNGWALARHEGMEAWQAIAQEKKRGLWHGEFVLPERWRKGERLPGE